MAKKPETIFKERVQKDLKREIKNGWFFKVQQRSLRGIPDVIGCVKGKFVAMELKVPRTKTQVKADPLQEWVLSKIILANGIAMVVTPMNWQEVLTRLKALEGES